MKTTEQELMELTLRLLESVADNDWDTYDDLCDSNLTSFEPEARGHLIDGMEFHRFYFDHGGHMGDHRSSIVDPRVRMLNSDAALVTYVRLIQQIDSAGQPFTTAYEESRLWEKQSGKWQHVHFHRSVVR